MIGGIGQSAADLVRAFDSRQRLADNFTPHPRYSSPVQTVQAVQPALRASVQPPPSSSPAAAGEEQRWGLELSEAVERSAAIEPFERFSIYSNPSSAQRLR